MQTELLANSLRGALRMLTIARPAITAQGAPRRRKLECAKPERLTRVVRMRAPYGSADVETCIERGLGRWGQMDDLRGLGSRCLLLANFNSADTYPATSELELVLAMTNLLKDQGFNLTLGGSAGIPWFPTNEVLENLGVYQLAEKAEINVWITDQSRSWAEVATPLNDWAVLIPERIFDFDAIVYLPLVRTHRFAGFSQGMKLSMGVVHPWTRRHMHVSQLEEKVAALAAVLQPDLVVADARRSFATGGPEAGRVVEPGVILFGSDLVTMEVQGMKELASAATGEGLRLHTSPEDERMIRAARGFGVSSHGLGSFEVVDGVGDAD